MVKDCTLNTDKLSPGGLHRNGVVRINDRPDMASAVYRGRKTTNQINKNSKPEDTEIDNSYTYSIPISKTAF